MSAPAVNHEVAQQPACSYFTSPDRPTWELYSQCIHCGLCLNQCPTYRVLGTEMDSPRGRIYQVLLADAGRLPISDSFVTHLDRCLGCRACETACPSGFHYGRILERARGESAALRNLANAARMLDENPSLLQLRALQALADSSGNTLVLGIHDGAVPLTRQNRRDRPAPAKEDPREE